MRLLLTLLLITTVILSDARPVTPDEATAVAYRFINDGSYSPKSAARHIRQVDIRIKSSLDTIQPYYVFNVQGNNGFVIVGGDNRAQSVLGHSDTGAIDPDNIPPQLSWLLDQYTEFINQLTTEDIHPSWRAPKQANTDDEVLLETANWGQMEPYNKLTYQFPTGCVATAMAIVMKYHNWPNIGRRKHKTISGRFIDFGAVSFDWDLMDELLDGDGVNDLAAREISKLMKAAGEAIDTQYAPAGSAANDALIGRTLFEYFRYSPQAQTIHAYNFTKEEWKKLIRDELNNKRPVIYGANSLGRDAHEFVCDGYKGDEYHINWGWDGASNGYFHLETLMGYNVEPNMTINIYPDNSDVEEYSELFIDSAHWCTIGPVYKPCGLNVSTADIKPGEPFYVSLAQGEVLDKLYFCAIALAIVAEDGTIKDFVYPCEELGEGIDKRAVWTYGNQYLYDVIAPNITTTDFPLMKVVTNCSSLSETDRIQVVSRRMKEPGKDGIVEDFSFVENQWKPVLGTLETPTSIPIKGNKPKGSALQWHIDGDVTVVLHGFFDNTDFLLRNGAFHFRAFHGQGICSVKVNEIEISVTPCPVGSEFILYPTTDYCDLTVSFIPLSELEDLELNIQNPGTLATLLSNRELWKISSLKLSGNIDMRDLYFISNNILNLDKLDLSDCKIRAFDTCPENAIANTDILVPFPNSVLASSTLTQLILPKTLEYIGLNSISCTNVHTLYLPASMTKMDGEFENFVYQTNAFHSLRLRCVHTDNPIPFDMDEGAIFISTYGRDDIREWPTTLVVPKGAKEAYQSSSGWNCFTEIVEMDSPAVFDRIIDGVCYIGCGAKAILYDSYYFDIPEHLVLRDSVEFNGKQVPVVSLDHNHIFEGVFGMKFPNLNYLTLNESLTYINRSSFYCTGTEVIYALNRECLGDADFYPGSIGVDNLDYSTVKVFCPYLYRNLIFRNDEGIYDYYYPGKFPDIEGYGKEMWIYNINRAENGICVIPQIENVTIDNVIINGIEYTPSSDNRYFDVSISNEILDVVVEYTVDGRQRMSTHYPADFNALLLDEPLSGLENSVIPAESDSLWDVYSIDGFALRRAVTIGETQKLSRGIYILKNSSQVLKIKI